MEAVRQFSLQVNLDYLETADEGFLETRDRTIQFQTEFNNSDLLTVAFADQYELLERPFEISPGVTIPSGGYAFRGLSAGYNFGLQRPYSGSLSFERGSFYSGDITSLGFGRGRVELTEQFSLEPSLSLIWVDLPQGSFSTRLVVTRVNYTFTPRMFLSGLVQYNSASDTFSTNLRLRWEYQAGSELFVVYTEDRNTDTIGRFSDLSNRGIVIKFNRLFRL
jgi:hypothetical protein